MTSFTYLPIYYFNSHGTNDELKDLTYVFFIFYVSCMNLHSPYYTARFTMLAYSQPNPSTFMRRTHTIVIYLFIYLHFTYFTPIGR